MTRKTVGVVHYGVGNHSSVLRTFQALGHRCILTDNREELSAADFVVLPGVGAYPTAMSALRQSGLATYLCGLAEEGKPLIGLCLGMQLLADHSLEHATTEGLGLIPGSVRPLPGLGLHVGWNSIKVLKPESILSLSDGESFYFNHSYAFDVPERYQAAVSHVHGASFTAAVRRDNVVGLQFHPEKSQDVGKQLLHRLLEGLGNA